MKFFLTVFVLAFLMISCGGEDTSGESSDGTTEDTDEPTIDMDGPDIEINVLSFSVEDRKTEIEVINRLDEGIKSVSGDLTFLDSTGNVLTNLFGSPRSTHFQHMQNPVLVESMGSKKITLENKLEEETVDMDVRNIKVKTVSGEKIKFKEE